MPGSFIVRYGVTRIVGEFSFRGSTQLQRTDPVLVRTSRGVEWGEVLCEATDRTREYLGSSEEAGRVLRKADTEAQQKLDEVHLREKEVFYGGKRIIKEHKLQMNLVDVECVYGGERIVFYYLAEQRVDFRELVKALAKEFHTRIEMRQIGVRDEAKLLADYGDCGKPVCCGTHLREMPPVSMKMAKMQKATLDPNKISGRCGRLKCCLRYEYDTYEEYRRDLPNAGSVVLTKQGQGKVIGQEILAQKVLVMFEGGRRMLVDKADIVTVVNSKKNNPKGEETTKRDGDANRGDRESPAKDRQRTDRSSRKSVKDSASSENAKESDTATADPATDSSSDKSDSGNSADTTPSNDS